MTVIAEQIAGLSDLYRLNALGFAHPVPELHAQLTNGYFQRHYDARQHKAGRRPARIPRATVNFEQFEADYITLFQVGGRGSPPCSLCESDYGLGEGSRGEQLVELTRFYRNFGLRQTTDAEENEQPDHLTCELELMAFLSFRQADACSREIDDAPYRLAQRDFLERRLGAWTPAFVQRVTGTAKVLNVDPIFPALALALGELIRDHLEQLSRQCQSKIT